MKMPEEDHLNLIIDENEKLFKKYLKKGISYQTMFFAYVSMMPTLAGMAHISPNRLKKFLEDMHNDYEEYEKELESRE